MRHRANRPTSVAPYCHLFNTVATAYNGKIVVSVRMVRMSSDGVVKMTFGFLVRLQFLPLSHSSSSSSSALASRAVGAQMLSALT